MAVVEKRCSNTKNKTVRKATVTIATVTIATALLLQHDEQQ